MATDSRRIPLLTRTDAAPQRDWDTTHDAPERLVLVHAFTVLRYALSTGSAAMTHDVARLVIDHAATPAEFLELLAMLPPEFAGDVVLLSSGSAFLSATGRGGNRVLYALTRDDVDFYLRTHGLVAREMEVAA